MKDQLLVFHEFATLVARTLEEKGVKPEEGFMCAVLCVVAPTVEGAEPLGGSINFDPKTSKWRVDEQLEPPQKV